MARLSDIVDQKGKVNYEQLVKLCQSYSRELFVEQARHPLLVGKELYDGSLTQREGNSDGSSTHTLVFSAAEFRAKTVSDATAPLAQKRESSISRAIYWMRKSQESVEKTPNIIAVGRAMNNDMVVPDYVVSKHHAKIHIFYGKYFIEDNGSTNGTSVNGRRVEPGSKVQLPINSQIAFGRLCFVFISPADLHSYLSR